MQRSSQSNASRAHGSTRPTRALFPAALSLAAFAAHAAASAPSAIEPRATRHASSAHTTSAMVFEPEVSAPSGVPSPDRFLARGRNGIVSLTAAEARVTLPGTGRKRSEVRMELIGARSGRPVAGEESQGKTHYFLGNDRSQWVRNVPSWRRVRASEAYPGVDVVYYGNDRSLEYDFVVAPGADPNAIQLAFKDEAGRPLPLGVTPAGELTVGTGDVQVVQSAPVVYQERGGDREPVMGRYQLTGSGPEQRVQFALGNYDPCRELVIDPVLKYFQEPGGYCNDVAVDAQGFPYVTGSMYAEVEEGLLAHNAFVRKFSKDGERVIYSAVFGGTGSDFATGLAVDAEGSAYVAGQTDSHDLPVLNAVQPEIVEDPEFWWTQDAFLTKLSPDGSELAYSTYLGGSGVENAWMDGDIAVDAEGSAYLIGSTASPDLPVSNAFQSQFGSAGADDPYETDVFLAKLSPAGNSLVYATYLGGAGMDSAGGVALGPDGDVIVAGGTTSLNFPTLNAVRTEHGNQGGLFDGFVTRFEAAGDSLVYSTYLSGINFELANDVAVDAAGNTFVVGETNSPDFLLVNAFQDVLLTPPPVVGDFGPIFPEIYTDVFVTKLDPSGAALFSTFLGGAYGEAGLAVETDAGGNPVVAGITDSADYPAIDSPTRSEQRLDLDGFITKLRADGSALVSSQYIGDGSRNDYIVGVSLNEDGDQYTTGFTDIFEVTDFPEPRGIGSLGRPTAQGGRGGTGVPDPSRKARFFVGRYRDKKRQGAGKLSFSTEKVKFRTLAGQPARRALRLVNEGGKPLDVTLGNPRAPYTILRGGGAFRLAPGASRNVVLELNTSTVGLHQVRLNLTSGRTKQRQSVLLDGRVKADPNTAG